MLAGCGGSQPPIGPTGAISEGSLRDASSSSLVYSTFGCNGVCIFKMAGKKVGRIDDPQLSNEGLCSDSNGDVFVTAFGASPPGPVVVVEYPHGGSTPTRTVRPTGILATQCSVDPNSGDLAVVVMDTPSWGSAVEVFKPGSSTPTVYGDSSLVIGQCGYDASGNLFVGGTSISQGGPRLAELPAGRGTFVPISLKLDGELGQIQWDGAHITVESLASKAIDVLQINGSKAQIISTIALNGVKNLGLSWIQGSQVAAGDSTRSSGEKYVGLWAYPEGGGVTQIVRHVSGYHRFFASTISVEPSR